VASACAWSVALVGLDGRIVAVEADSRSGLNVAVVEGITIYRPPDDFLRAQ
jgi:hypothetical protein